MNDLTPHQPTVQAAGVLLMTRQHPQQFLLMRHPDRWDLPKGHSETGETPRQTAMREFVEETGLDSTDVELDSNFEFQIEYFVRYRRETVPKLKRVYYYLAWIDKPCSIDCTEHDSSQWFAWSPPHQIQSNTIDPLLAAVAEYLRLGS